MKVKILPYLVFFLLSLAAAYFTSGPSKERQGSAQEWIAIAKDGVKRISYDSEGKTTVIEKDGDSYWVDASATTKTPEGEKLEKDRFIASDKMKDVLDSLASFQIEKVIGAAKDLKLEEFGLDKPTGHFEVNYGKDQSFKLALGKRGFQSPEIFVLDEAKQNVLLVAKQFFAPFERAKARLALSVPYRFNPDDVSSVALNRDDKHQEFVRQIKGENKMWFTRGKLDAPNEAFRNWLDKLLKIRIETYAEASDAARIEKLPAKFSVLLGSDKEELDLFLVLEDTSSSPTRYWLKSKKLPVPVQVETDKVSTLLADLSALIP